MQARNQLLRMAAQDPASRRCAQRPGRQPTSRSTSTRKARRSASAHDVDRRLDRLGSRFVTTSSIRQRISGCTCRPWPYRMNRRPELLYVRNNKVHGAFSSFATGQWSSDRQARALQRRGFDGDQAGGAAAPGRRCLDGGAGEKLPPESDTNGPASRCSSSSRRQAPCSMRFRSWWCS